MQNSEVLQILEGSFNELTTTYNRLTEVETDFIKLFNERTDNKLSADNVLLLFRSAILGYLQKFDIDNNIEVVDFGCREWVRVMTHSLNVLLNETLSETDVEQKLSVGLLCKVSNYTIDEYIQNKQDVADFEHIEKLLVPNSDSNKNQDIIQFIYDNPVYNGLLVNSVNAVLGVYNYLFQDSFGLRPYAGVLSMDKEHPFMTINKNGIIRESLDMLNNEQTATIFKNFVNSFNNLNSNTKDGLGIKTQADRQFDVKQMLKSSSPLYYPAKILEFAMGRELTKEQQHYVYKEHAKKNNWEEYLNEYISPQITDILLDAVYYSLENFYTASQKLKDDDVFISDTFKAMMSSDRKSIIDPFTEPDCQDAVNNGVLRVRNSLCCAVLVTKCNVFNNKVNAANFRLTDVVGSRISVSSTEKIYGWLRTNASTVFADGDIISNDVTYRNEPIAYPIYEFRHDFDFVLSSAEPLFGYTAVQLYKNQGKQISWDKILLGEDIKGTPIFASLAGADDIRMQSFAVHNMMAGSRSGKGVMTMNMLASAIASEKPIFYIDRKPDMSVLFNELSNGHMFVVNGGQYVSKNDMEGVFSENGAALQGWTAHFQSLPDYIKDLFPRGTYEGDAGDYVYYRAMMFVLGILMARVECINAISDLGGQNGIVAVFDEFKNWQITFESKFFDVAGKFGNENRVTKQIAEKYKGLQKKIKDNERNIQTIDNSEKNASKKVDEYQRNIDSAKEELKECITPTQVYCTTVMNKLGESFKHIAGNLSAGFKDSEGKVSDIFVIGQNIEKDGYDGSSEPSGTYPVTSTGVFNNNSSTKGRSLMRGILDAFQHDWFMGYNQDSDSTKKYFGADVENSTAKKWITDRMYWAHIGGTSMDILRTTEPPHAKYFKPYLVLNKHWEDDPNQIEYDEEGKPIYKPGFEFVGQCRDRVNKAVPHLWEEVRKKHLVDKNDESYRPDALNPGIGFEGLATQTKQTIKPDATFQASDLQKSEDIANYVANLMGYTNYRDLLFDFSPQGIFSTSDVVSAVKLGDATKYIATQPTRLELFYKYGIFKAEATGGETVASDKAETTFSSLFDEAEGGLASQSNLDLVKELDNTTKQVNSVNEPTSTNVFETETPSVETPIVVNEQTQQVMNNVVTDMPKAEQQICKDIDSNTVDRVLAERLVEIIAKKHNIDFSKVSNESREKAIQDALSYLQS